MIYSTEISNHSHGSTSVVPRMEKFTGTDHSKWPRFINNLYLALHANKIETSAEGKVSVDIQMRSYRTTTKEVQIQLGETLTADDILDGLTHLDYRLTPKNLRTYRDDIKKAESNRKHAFAILISGVEEGSTAEITTRKFSPAYDFDGAIASFKLSSRAETLAVLLSFSFAKVNLERSKPGQLPALQINGEVLKIRDDFMSVAKAVVKSDSDTQAEFDARKARGEILYEFCNRYALLQTLSKEDDIVQKFVNSKIRENTESLQNVDLRAIDALFEANMNAANTGVIRTTETISESNGVKPVEINYTTPKPEGYMSRKDKKKYAIYLAQIGKPSQYAPDCHDQKKSKPSESDAPRCEWCNLRGHGIEHCFHNPDRTNKHTHPTPIGFVTKPRQTFIAMLHINASGTSAKELSTFDKEF